MPQAFLRAQMTKDGEKLYARAAAGECKPEYIYLAVGDGVYTENEKTKEALKARTELKEKKNRYSFTAYRPEEESLYLETLITNYDKEKEQALVNEGYYINEIGIYAREQGQTDGEEKLISICVTASSTGLGDYMPPYNGSPAEITQGYYIAIADAENITVKIEQMDHTVMFNKAKTREIIESGEKVSVLFGKIAKFMDDAKKVAFTADYNDLEGIPNMLPANGGIATKAKQDINGNNIIDTYSKKEDTEKVQYDVAEIIFQMSIRDMTDNSKFRNVIVDNIDSVSAVNLTTGSYTTGKVYI